MEAFNTKRPYTLAGQRIAFEVIGAPGAPRILFVDVDRNIAGVTLSFPVDGDAKEWLMRMYDEGSYNLGEWHEYHPAIPEGLLQQLKVYARNQGVPNL